MPPINPNPNIIPRFPEMSQPLIPSGLSVSKIPTDKMVSPPAVITSTKARNRLDDIKKLLGDIDQRLNYKKQGMY